MKHPLEKKAFQVACGLAMTVPFFLGLSGCASADATTQQLGIQTDQNRAILSGEQEKSGELLAHRRSLQNQLARLKSRQDLLVSQPATPESQEELRQVNSDIEKLRKAINSFQN